MSSNRDILENVDSQLLTEASRKTWSFLQKIRKEPNQHSQRAEIFLEIRRLHYYLMESLSIIEKLDKSNTKQSLVNELRSQIDLKNDNSFGYLMAQKSLLEREVELESEGEEDAKSDSDNEMDLTSKIDPRLMLDSSRMSNSTVESSKRSSLSARSSISEVIEFNEDSDCEIEFLVHDSDSECQEDASDNTEPVETTKVGKTQKIEATEKEQRKSEYKLRLQKLKEQKRQSRIANNLSTGLTPIKNQSCNSDRSDSIGDVTYVS
jgi:hypothetical protein